MPPVLSFDPVVDLTGAPSAVAAPQGIGKQRLGERICRVHLERVAGNAHRLTALSALDEAIAQLDKQIKVRRGFNVDHGLLDVSGGAKQLNVQKARRNKGRIGFQRPAQIGKRLKPCTRCLVSHRQKIRCLWSKGVTPDGAIQRHDALVILAEPLMTQRLVKIGQGVSRIQFQRRGIGCQCLSIISDRERVESLLREYALIVDLQDERLDAEEECKSQFVAHWSGDSPNEKQNEILKATTPRKTRNTKPKFHTPFTAGPWDLGL